MTIGIQEALRINTLRFLSVDAVEQARSGHPGTPMEAAGLGYFLWDAFLKHNPENPQWANRDRFVLSAGHASMLLYSLLFLNGYSLTLDDMKAFRQWNSQTPGHPEFGHTPGVETTTGPLGQGFATGVGMALGERWRAARFNRPGFPVVDHAVWAFVSDGDMMEGLSSEAASLAGHLRLSKLKYVYLDNRITIEGNTSLTFSEDVGRRFDSYGWRVLRVDDPENSHEVKQAYKQAQEETERPTLIIARTHIGFGCPHKQDTSDAHGAPLGAEETKLAKEKLGWPGAPSFFVPDDVKSYQKQAQEKGRSTQKTWDDLFQRYRQAHPDLADQWDQSFKSVLPNGWKEALPFFKTGDDMATRQASGKTLNALAGVVPCLIGGSADLAPSNNTHLSKESDFSHDNPAGRNIHFGIREHAMGAILNGLALEGPTIPYGGTFLTFADYMRPSIRLAALMKLAVVYVFTHDSIGLGEDGPTHQPVEHLASLRCIPNLTVIRPGDANETVHAWRAALENRRGPTALILSRQKLRTINRTLFSSAEGTEKGAYLLNPEGPKDLLFLASGSEIELALEAKEVLEAEGIRVGVVSFPSWELFEKQDQSYKDSVLPPTLKTRVVIEAGVSQGWHRYAGTDGALVTMDRFGASAPGDVLMEKFGFNKENVVRVARDCLKKRTLS